MSIVFTSCARFCGKFKDQHADSPDASEESDDEGKNNAYKPTDFQKVVRHQQQNSIKGFLRRKVKKTEEGTKVNADIFWRAKQVRLEITDEGRHHSEAHCIVDAVLCKNMRFTPLQLKHLKTMSYLHTIDLIKCDLTECPPDLAEIDSLQRINFSCNKIQALHRTLVVSSGSRATHLRRLVLEDNQLSYIDTQVLAGDQVRHLLVLNLAKNKLAYLPNDFLYGATNLEFCDLSSNLLQCLPDSVLTCRKMRVLDMCCNDLRELPHYFHHLARLRKVFLQTNKLKELPPNLRDLINLEKLWVSQNQIRYLPYDLIELWHTNGGPLCEIAVEDNPLVSPSITAYQVGGPDRMFKLFEEQRVEEMARKHEQELTLASLASEQHDVALQEIELTIEERDMMPEEGFASVPRMINEKPWLPVDAKNGVVLSTVGDIDGIAMEGSLAPRIDASSFYFADLGDPANVTTIRSMEASLLLLKKSMYVEQLKKSMQMRVAGSQERLDQLPEKAKRLLDPKFNPIDFHGRAHVIEFDICMCLFASCARGEAISAASLFKRFAPNTCSATPPPIPVEERDNGWTCRTCSFHNEPGPRGETCKGGIMKKKDFDGFCARIPIEISADMQWRMWYWMRGLHKNDKLDEISVLEFVAALHIHDISEKDPFISRVASVLKLLYYRLTPHEFEQIVRSRSSPSASLGELDVPSDDEELFEAKRIGETAELEAELLHEQEGERHARIDNSVEQRNQPSAKKKIKKREPLISLTEAQYWDRQGESDRDDDALDATDPDGGYDLPSDELSESDLSDSSFDADDCFEKLAEMEDDRQQEEQEAAKPLDISSDADLEKLMMMPANKIGVVRPTGKDNPIQVKRLAARKLEKAKQAAKLAEKKKEHTSASIVRDPRFVTNMLSVRKAIREAYRNVPFHDFVQLINFLLRKAKDIRHCPQTEHFSFWSASDPSLKAVLGSRSTNPNPYPTAILKEMGFILLLDTYWVWPEKHLRSLSSLSLSRLVPANSVGLDENRLDDIIKLVSQCKKIIDHHGMDFKGHIGGTFGKTPRV